MSHALTLSPGGHLFVELDDQTEPKLTATVASRLSGAFNSSGARGLELLVSEFLHEPLPPTFNFWRDLARRYFTALCHNPNLGGNATELNVAPPSEAELAKLAETAPPMKGLEYLNNSVLARLWDELGVHVRSQIAGTSDGPGAYLKSCNSTWNAVGRVTFHLAENKRNPERPFAFLATYTHAISGQGKVQHMPLGRALEEYAGTKNHRALAALLSPVQRAAEQSKVARQLLDSRAVFHPQVWLPDQAFAFLKDVLLFEQSGVIVRIPDWWKAGHPPRPQVRVRIGEKTAGLLNRDTLLDFQVELFVGDEPLTESEVESLLESTNGLALLKGKWVEVDREKLTQVLDHWKTVQSTTGRDGLPLLEGLRLLSGFQPGGATETETDMASADWSRVSAGKHLKKLLDEIQGPEVSAESDPGNDLLAELRPYQRQGVHWLWFMHKLGLGSCLADDMGLGKTIQVLALLLVLKRKQDGASPPSLLIVPASLIANWKGEIQKFAPSLQVLYAHPAEVGSDELKDPAKLLIGKNLVVTSYSMLTRLAWLPETNWNIVILDEAQAIKNAGAKQSRGAKALRCRHRIALSGTPIENRLSDLWSLFDFLCPGLLGGPKEFSAYLKRRSKPDQESYAGLRRLVKPYILRRLKTDKRIITDLPAKTEMTAFCPLTRRQAALYQQAVTELGELLNSGQVEGIQRRGVILGFITRFKQICNHPSHWLGDGAYAPADSGKFHRLRELCEEIASRQEKVLVFTQYREITEALARHLESIFGRSGAVLHGGTPLPQRKKLVDSFQGEGGPPFFILSLKAGGTGLNLTSASHVIHFDRWWNPAVENQATDRAFRIGQKQNVMVHKFTCRGTLEERIHQIIADKSSMAEDILGEGGERLMTEMENSELLRFVALDIKAASED